jgi:hypothetical protein
MMAEEFPDCNGRAAGKQDALGTDHAGLIIGVGAVIALMSVGRFQRLH